MKLSIYLLFFFSSVTALANVKPEVVLTTGHNDQINAMVVSSDNKYLASSGNNKIIKIWDIASSREFRSISGTDGRVDQLAFSSDNIHLVGTSSNNELIVWNVVSGKEVFKGECDGSFKGLSFFNDGKDIIYLNKNSQITVLNLETKTEETLLNDLYITSMIVDQNKQMVYAYGLNGEIVYYDLIQKELVKTIQLFDKVIFTFTSPKISKDGRYIVNTFIDDKIRVFDTQEEKIIFESKKYKAKIMAFEMDAIEPIVYFTLHTGEVMFYDYLKHKKVYSFTDPSFIANCMTVYPAGEVLILANFNLIRFIDTKSKKLFKSLKPKVSKIINMAYDQQGKYLAVASNKATIQIWDLRLNKIVNTLQGFFPCEFSPDGKELATMSYTTNVAIWDVNTWKKKKELSTEFELIQKMAFSADGKFMAGSGYNKVIKIWDRETGKIIKKLEGHSAGVLALDFHPTKTILASGSHDETVRIWDFLKEKELKQFKDQRVVVSGVKFSPDGKQLSSSAWDKTIYVRNTETWETVHVLKGHTNSIMGLDYNKDGNVLVSYATNNAVSVADNSLMFWDTKTGGNIGQVNDHESGITKAFFDLDADYVFSSSDDGTIKISDYKKLKNIVTYVAVGDKEFMIYTPENYYIASRNALDGIAFRIDGTLVPFEQFDIYLNRPDVVAKEIGKSPDALIRAYKYLYKKRLRKYNLDEGSINQDYHIPKLLNETKTPLITANNSLKVNVKCWDDLYTIKQINIYVNGTPIFGESGFKISGDLKSYRKTFDIPLLDEKNKIQISCFNSNGAESLYETFEVFKEATSDKNDLYIVTIGVSDYQDARFSLKYPTKDAKDMIAKLTESKDLYANIHTKMLLNEDVTKDKFLTLNDFFENARHNDVAIIFVAGHGVLDANFDYFYGTYDMDFNAPALKGLAYDEIHKLLNQIKSYRKLLIMDTCHSGELDKDEIEEGPEPEVDESNIEFRSAGVAVREKEGFGFENSLELMQDIFSDTRKGSGAIVISSAGGAEYAMESDQWKNGLFTYAFLSGLNNVEADFNKDGVVQVSEIRRYVNDKVKKISGGKQIPSSREENISQDYVIFAKTL